MEEINTLEINAGRSAHEILEANPKFKEWARRKCAILGYTKKLYALGLVEINSEGQFKGHAHSSDPEKLAYWEDYAQFVNYVDFLRQIDLHLEGKIDKYTGGKDEANYDFKRDHYILYETRISGGTEATGGSLHTDRADSVYFYETGTRNSIGPTPTGQGRELAHSLRIPQGPVEKRIYLKHSRGCPMEEFFAACKELKGVDDAIADADPEDEEFKFNRLINGQSYMSLTEAADLLDKEKYDYVLLPNGHLIVLNQEATVDPAQIAEIELADAENERLERLYSRYLSENFADIERGSQADLELFEKFVQDLKD